jgi:sulfate adenylyltransferase
VAICAPIAPYEASRREARRLVEETGALFFLVHVATPIEVCEQRDRKGLYARARAGDLPAFTGVSDPYEAPAAPDLVLDTSALSPRQGAEAIVAKLAERGFV